MGPEWNLASFEPADQPPMSLVLLSYNNAPYLKQALNGALSQTYDRLQIIMADDCSTDGSYEILKAAADAYNGPHQLLLHRNHKNLGIAGNLNRAAELATGVLITLAAGDDISDPRRVELVAAEFARDPSVRAVVSSHTVIDERGEVLEEVRLPRDFALFSRMDSLAKNGGFLHTGATFTYHRDCFFKPGPIPPEILCEDCILPMRALALGSIAHRCESLVQYRRHGKSADAGGASTSREYGQTQQRILLSELAWMRDNELINFTEYKRALRGIRGYLHHFERANALAKREILGRLYTALYHHERTRRRILLRIQELLGRSNSRRRQASR